MYIEIGKDIAYVDGYCELADILRYTQSKENNLKMLNLLVLSEVIPEGVEGVVVIRNMSGRRVYIEANDGTTYILEHNKGLEIEKGRV